MYIYITNFIFHLEFKYKIHESPCSMSQFCSLRSDLFCRIRQWDGTRNVCHKLWNMQSLFLKLFFRFLLTVCKMIFCNQVQFPDPSQQNAPPGFRSVALPAGYFPRNAAVRKKQFDFFRLQVINSTVHMYYVLCVKATEKMLYRGQMFVRS